MVTERPLLPPGTRVQRKLVDRKITYDPPRHRGTVAPYNMTTSDGQPMPGNIGTFPVRFDDGQWQTCDITDVIVVTKTISQVDAA